MTCCETIKKQIREQDILFRLGGDEFVIIFHESKIAVAMGIWNNIQSELKGLYRTNQKPYPISASHGLYQYKSGTVISPEEILQLADQEMYKEKFAQRK